MTLPGGSFTPQFSYLDGIPISTSLSQAIADYIRAVVEASLLGEQVDVEAIFASLLASHTTEIDDIPGLRDALTAPPPTGGGVGIADLPFYADDTAARAGGLANKSPYIVTSTGAVRVVLEETEVLPLGKYFATTGSDTTGDGTIGNPYKTLQKAHTEATPGTNVYGRGGVYYLTATQQLTNDGTSGNMIVCQPFPGETVIFDCTSVPNNSYTASCAIRLNNCSFTHIKDFEIRYAPDFGIKLEGASNDNIIERCHIHHIGVNASGNIIGSPTISEGKGLVVFNTGARNLIKDNDIHHCTNTGTKPYENADGIQVSTSGTCSIIGNRVWLCADDGIDVFNIHDNTVQGNYLIDSNICWLNGYQFNGTSVAGNGSGIKAGGIRAATTGRNGNHTITRNILFSNRVYGLNDNYATHKQYWSHNVAYDTRGVNVGYNYYIAGNNAIEMKNNIHVIFSNDNIEIHSSAILTTNSWQGGKVANASDFLSMDVSLLQGARAADGTVPGRDTVLRLVGGSDLKATGTAISGWTYAGAAPDIGYTDYPPP